MNPSIEYWSAVWCQPCKTLKPKVQAMCLQYGWPLVEYDLDDNAELAASLGIQSVPTLFLRVDGHTTPVTGSAISLQHIRKVRGV